MSTDMKVQTTVDGDSTEDWKPSYGNPFLSESF